MVVLKRRSFGTSDQPELETFEVNYQWGTPLTLTESEKTILSFILKEGPCHGYKIHKETNISDKTAYTSLRKLTEKELLMMKGPDGKPRPGQEMKVYHLTLSGLLTELRLNREIWKDIDKIIEKWRNVLPFVFDRWNMFEKYGVKEEALKRLELTTSIQNQCNHVGMKLDPQRATDLFYLSFNNPSWRRLLTSDVEIKTYYTEELAKCIKNEREQLTFYEQLLREARRRRSPGPACTLPRG